MAKIESEELTALVRSTIESIEKGLKEGYELKEPIEFEVAVVNMKSGEGGIKLLIVTALGKYDKEAVSKIKFKIGKKNELGGRVF